LLGPQEERPIEEGTRSIRVRTMRQVNSKGEYYETREKGGEDFAFRGRGKDEGEGGCNNVVS